MPIKVSNTREHCKQTATTCINLILFKCDLLPHTLDISMRHVPLHCYISSENANKLWMSRLFCTGCTNSMKNAMMI